MVPVTSVNIVLGVRPRLGSTELASLACWALVAGAELTPKPGLVDRRGAGPRKERTLALMMRSAEALRPFFQSMAEAARHSLEGLALRERLGEIGRTAEEEMYRATGGTNTHKGAIWTMGLLVAAAASGQYLPSRIATDAGSLARFRDRFRRDLTTHGGCVFHRHGIRGAMGEAQDGFPHVIDVGLPTLRASRRDGKAENESRICALLAVMASLDDTSVIYHGGEVASATVRAGALSVLTCGGPGTAAGDEALRLFDCKLVRQGISPCGSANLLAAVLFLDVLEELSAPDFTPDRILELRREIHDLDH